MREDYSQRSLSDAAHALQSSIPRRNRGAGRPFGGELLFESCEFILPSGENGRSGGELVQGRKLFRLGVDLHVRACAGDDDVSASG